MRVETDHKYTYETGNIEVKLGDKVIVPVAGFLQDVYGTTREVTVTSLDSDYDGYCVRIIKKSGEEEPEPERYKNLSSIHNAPKVKTKTPKNLTAQQWRFLNTLPLNKEVHILTTRCDEYMMGNTWFKPIARSTSVGIKSFIKKGYLEGDCWGHSATVTRIK